MATKKNKQLEWLIGEIRELQQLRFYGDYTIKFMYGNITITEKLEKKKPPDVNSTWSEDQTPNSDG